MLDDELAVLRRLDDLRVWIVHGQGSRDKEALFSAEFVVIVVVVLYYRAHNIDIFLQIPSIKLGVEEDKHDYRENDGE